MPAVRRQLDDYDDTTTTTEASPRSKAALAVVIEGVAVIVNRRVRQQMGHPFEARGLSRRSSCAYILETALLR